MFYAAFIRIRTHSKQAPKHSSEPLLQPSKSIENTPFAVLFLLPFSNLRNYKIISKQYYSLSDYFP